MNAYILRYQGNKKWNIFVRGAEDKKPVISLSCNRKIAQEIIDSLDRGKGVPAHLTGAITKGKEKNGK